MSAILECRELTKSFGGVDAVADLSFTVDRGHIHSIIGPNGAGKTTLINLLTGIYTPTAGSILLSDHDTRGLAPYKLAQRGLGRTFQNLQICMNMSAVENVMVGRHLRLNRGFVSALLRLPSVRSGDRDCRARALELMRFVGLEDQIDQHPSEMSYGALKRLEIARSLAAEPELLFLDEPAAGLNANETHAIGALIRELAASGVTVVLVEHDMKLVMDISDDVLVLNYGRKLAQGTPQAVQNDPEVVAAYLGGA
ncbi:ABC transporter ATP-binding protein [uncultured Salinisphaera sp.]|uniref:ABC transporter ATP-binding protein n=1 Tax=uncultured Salinisphaera sp. TaxID=359372 RepID=UPI0032B2CA92